MLVWMAVGSLMLLAGAIVAILRGGEPVSPAHPVSPVAVVAAAQFGWCMVSVLHRISDAAARAPLP